MHPASIVDQRRPLLRGRDSLAVILSLVASLTLASVVGAALIASCAPISAEIGVLGAIDKASRGFGFVMRFAACVNAVLLLVL
ncbi:hypothetical protein BC830DRAFT_1140893 [Chytriomyces sp. MP71]|nr:hypothetical protein BC830DRAFT_1140893 [Chytriomyces sp. MP71]